MRREAAEYINRILDQDDPDVLETQGSSRISQMILTGGIKPAEADKPKEAVIEDCRGQLTDVVGFRK